jgi:bidirectional [NiFe] hydrogenase diaphorase subunit
MAPITLFIDEKQFDVEPGQTILEVARKSGIDIPVLCNIDGLSTWGACRLCVVEVEGSPRLFPACTTPVQANMKIKTQSEKLAKYRRMTVELLFSERNHICSVCVANNRCELQNLGYRLGMDHVRFPYLTPECHVDASHPDYVIDHNRCVLCTRCVRTCDEVEGAHNWDIAGRGTGSRVVSDLWQPWGESSTCTSCGKCVQACPVGAIWPKDKAQGQLAKNPGSITELIAKRKVRS